MDIFIFVSSRPCDIVGDISYEELRATAYDDARKGLPLTAIVSLTNFFPLVWRMKEV